MKKFNFKFSVVAIILMLLCFLLFIAGLILAIINMTQNNLSDTITFIIHIILCVIDVALLVLIASVLFYGKYVIKDDYLYTYFGFIKSKTPISDIVEVNHFKKSNKLVIYYKDKKYSVVVINPKEYDDFIVAIREVNPSIYYEQRIDGEDTPKKY